jgi:hypothetical protein
MPAAYVTLYGMKMAFRLEVNSLGPVVKRNGMPRGMTEAYFGVKDVYYNKFLLSPIEFEMFLDKVDRPARYPPASR